MSHNETEQSALALLGDEAAALGALHAGLSAAYGYPGTPSTEIMEYLLAEYEARVSGGNAGGTASDLTVRWCSNEKTAVEAALGASLAGKRAIVTMKHVGLNAAADPFVNGALLDINGGLVIACADDPGMHSSQDEQDSRFYAAFAMIPCLEPRSQQQAYDMAREAFDVSERFHVPVLLRFTTRLSHARAQITVSPPRGTNPLSKAGNKAGWMLLPAYARKNYAALIEKQKAINEWSENHAANKLDVDANSAADFAVITSGLGGNYYEENLDDLIAASGGKVPARLHIGAYPIPVKKIRTLCERNKKVLVIEEGQPFVEEKLRGILPTDVTVIGKLGGEGITLRGVGAANSEGILACGQNPPRSGELDPDNVRAALGLAPRKSAADTVSADFVDGKIGRPPQLCAGCPHGDSYETIKMAMADYPFETRVVTSDIGCYSLGASPPYEVPESILCMGASIGMAKGAADSGITYALAVIGDSTFIHSGIPALIDAAAADVPMTVAILDNSIVAMTGCQQTMVASENLPRLIEGLGVAKEHIVTLETKKQLVAENAAALKKELEYRGTSVVIFRRECLEAARKKRNKK